MQATNPLDTLIARQPLQIVVTAAGRENLMLRTLTRQAVPLLRRPTPCNRQMRLSLAETLEQALCTDISGDACEEEEGIPFPHGDAPPEDEEENRYEPGCLLDWEAGP